MELMLLCTLLILPYLIDGTMIGVYNPGLAQQQQCNPTDCNHCKFGWCKNKTITRKEVIEIIKGFKGLFLSDNAIRNCDVTNFGKRLPTLQPGSVTKEYYISTPAPTETRPTITPNPHGAPINIFNMPLPEATPTNNNQRTSDGVHKPTTPSIPKHVNPTTQPISSLRLHHYDPTIPLSYGDPGQPAVSTFPHQPREQLYGGNPSERYPAYISNPHPWRQYYRHPHRYWQGRRRRDSDDDRERTASSSSRRLPSNTDHNICCPSVAYHPVHSSFNKYLKRSKIHYPLVEFPDGEYQYIVFRECAFKSDDICKKCQTVFGIISVLVWCPTCPQYVRFAQLSIPNGCVCHKIRNG